MHFGKLEVVSLEGRDDRGNLIWKCVCDCGSDYIAKGTDLLANKVRSCGCGRTTHCVGGPHNGSGTKLYGVYNGMLNRCYNKNSNSYKNYGGRGIEVCSQWLDDFASFRDWAMANGYDENAEYHQCTIERIDNDLGYSPDNCRFATASEQNRNRRRFHNAKNCRPVALIDSDGNVVKSYKSMTDASEDLGVTVNGISSVCNGWHSHTGGMMFRYLSELEIEESASINDCDGQVTESLVDVMHDKAKRCCRTCAHATERHGSLKRGMRPLVCLLHVKAVPYVCGDGSNGITPKYPCHVAIDVIEGPVPAGWEAKDDQ